jgi:hypothetical protein
MTQALNLDGLTEEALKHKLRFIANATPDAIGAARLIEEIQHLVHAIIYGGERTPVPGNYLLTRSEEHLSVFCHRDYQAILTEAIGLIGTSMRVNLDVRPIPIDAYVLSLSITVRPAASGAARKPAA